MLDGWGEGAYWMFLRYLFMPRLFGLEAKPELDQLDWLMKFLWCKAQKVRGMQPRQQYGPPRRVGAAWKLFTVLTRFRAPRVPDRMQW